MTFQPRKPTDILQCSADFPDDPAFNILSDIHFGGEADVSAAIILNGR